MMPVSLDTGVMPIEPLSLMPVDLRAGTTLEYIKAFDAYPANGGYTLAVTLAGASGSISATVTASGAAFNVSLSPSQTAALIPGNYQWVERIVETVTGKKADAAWGGVMVLPNLEGMAAGAAQTWAEKTLAIVEAVLSGRATSDQEAYQIANRSVSRIPARELRGWREALRWEVRAQRNPGTLGPNVQVSFPSTILP